MAYTIVFMFTNVIRFKIKIFWLNNNNNNNSLGQTIILIFLTSLFVVIRGYFPSTPKISLPNWSEGL